MTFFIALFILVMQFLWKYIDDLVGKGLEWYLIAELLFYASATFVPLALPLAILISSLMTFGSLGERYELVSMKAAGVSLQKAMRPLIILSILISLFTFYFSNNILPIANLKFHTLLLDIREKKLTLNIKEGIFYKDLDGYIIRVGNKESDDIHIHDVIIYNHTDALGNIDVTLAKSGKMETTPDGRYMIFTLFDGYNYIEKVDVRGHRKSRPFERTSFKEQSQRFDLQAFEMNHTDEGVLKDHYMMLNLKQLNHTIDSFNRIIDDRFDRFSISFEKNFHFYKTLDSSNFQPNTFVDTAQLFNNLNMHDRAEGISKALSNTRSNANSIQSSIRDLDTRRAHVNRYVITGHEKFTLSFACLLLFFIGAPLGAIIRKGGLGLPVVISVIFFIFFHIASITGKKYVIAGVLIPEIGMWIASALLIPIGLFLTFKATNDAPILDADAWRKAFKFILDLRNLNSGKK